MSALGRLLIAGAGAAGAVGVGISVLVLSIKSVTDAGVTSTARITAGAGGAGNVTVKAEMVEVSTGLGFSGAAGIVGIAGQVIVLNDSGVQRAHIDGGAEIRRAGGGVAVSSLADRDIENWSIGVSIGGIGVGAQLLGRIVRVEPGRGFGAQFTGDARVVEKLLP